MHTDPIPQVLLDVAATVDFCTRAASLIDAGVYTPTHVLERFRIEAVSRSNARIMRTASRFINDARTSSAARISMVKASA